VKRIADRSTATAQKVRSWEGGGVQEGHEGLAATSRKSPKTNPPLLWTNTQVVRAKLAGATTKEKASCVKMIRSSNAGTTDPKAHLHLARCTEWEDGATRTGAIFQLFSNSQLGNWNHSTCLPDRRTRTSNRGISPTSSYRLVNQPTCIR
jgi:hypothetical protein